MADTTDATAARSYTAWDAITSGISNAGNVIGGIIGGISNAIANVWSAITGASSAAAAITTNVAPIVGEGATAVNTSSPTYGQNEYQVPIVGGLPMYQEGGYTGERMQLAVLHPHEWVIPETKLRNVPSNQGANFSGIQPVINVNFTGDINGITDMDKLAEVLQQYGLELSKIVAENYRRQAY
jgi:hypothetical protein